MLHWLRVTLGTICLVAINGCGGNPSDQPSAGASTEDIEAFIEDNPSYASPSYTSTQDEVQGSTAASDQRTSGNDSGSTSQPLELGN